MTLPGCWLEATPVLHGNRYAFDGTVSNHGWLPHLRINTLIVCTKW